MKPTTFLLAFILIITASLGFVYFTQGATLTNLNSTDIISNFPTTHNTNMANINSELLGVLTPARFTATSTSATSTIQWGLEIYSRHLAIGSTATTTIRGTATSTFSYGINAAVSGGCIAVNGTCLPSNSLSGTGSLNGLAYFDTLTTLTATSTQPLFIGSLSATTTATSSFVGGLYATRIAAPYFNATSTSATSTLTDLFFIDGQATSLSLSSAFDVQGAATFPGGVTITCTSCITDANVSNTLTASDLVAGSSVVSDAEVDGDLTISGGTINNSAIGATIPLTGAFTTLSSTGATAFYGALTLSTTSAVTLGAGGVLDAGAANSVEIPNGASPTVDATGECGLDTTSDQFKCFGASAVRIYGNGRFYPSLTYATSTAWAGTTTIPLGTAYVAETWNGIQCFTDAGTLQVSFNDGTNRMDFMNASTTANTNLLATNNTFTAGEKRYVDIGTPVSSPTKISCTVDKSLTAD